MANKNIIYVYTRTTKKPRMTKNIIYVYTRTTKKPRMTKNMLEIARINREAREHGVTYGVYVAGTYHIDTFNRSRHMELVNKYINAVKLS